MISKNASDRIGLVSVLFLVAAVTMISAPSFYDTVNTNTKQQQYDKTGLAKQAFAQKSTKEYVKNVELLLVQAKEQYLQGNGDRAHQLATEAYLDNYEFVEGPLGAIDPDLMVDVEIMMREELRSMIKQGQEKDKVASHIDALLIKMEQVEETLGMDIPPVKQSEKTTKTESSADSSEHEKQKMEQMLQYVQNIESLLDQVKDEYSNGNKDKAHNLATEAYLENYEYLEPEIAKQDKELMVQVEIMMREELRSMIKNDAPASEVNSQVDSILEKMQEIKAIVPEFGEIVVGILGVSAFGMMAMLIYMKKKAGREFSPVLGPN